MKTWLWIGLLATGVTGASASEVTGLLDNGTALWQQTPAQFAAQPVGKSFRWADEKKEVARATRGAVTLAGLPVWEALARFEGGVLREISVSLYNRGDAGDLGEVEFEKLVSGASEALTRWSGAKGIALRDQERTATVSLSRTAWVKEPHRLDLTWTFTPRRGTQPFRAEFVRVVITKYDPANAPRTGFRDAAGTSGPKKVLTIMDVRARVQREPAGDVAINGVPMVDQGQKGYCAAAVMERVLRYFGREMDQHEIAQMANTATKGGTSMQGMLSALRVISGELGCEAVTHVNFRVEDLERLVTEYNRLAQRNRQGSISLQRSGTINVNEMFQQMDGALLREARGKREADLQQFKTSITKYVSNGCPLIWGVMVGKVPEKPAVRGTGGHLRMIIGWNEQKKEVLYTDTWGAGHELKRMALTDAWAITLALYTIEPRNMRF